MGAKIFSVLYCLEAPNTYDGAFKRKQLTGPLTIFAKSVIAR